MSLTYFFLLQRLQLRTIQYVFSVVKHVDNFILLKFLASAAYFYFTLLIQIPTPQSLKEKKIVKNVKWKYTFVKNPGGLNDRSKSKSNVHNDCHQLFDNKK